MNMHKLMTGCIAASLLLGGVCPAFAHHGTSVTYDTSKVITVSGTVTEFYFGFPHVAIYLDVQNGVGKVTKWATELAPSPTMMKRLQVGWSKDSIKPGDKITLTCSPHREEGATACLSSRIVINGKLIPLNGEQIKEVNGGTPAP